MQIIDTLLLVLAALLIISLATAGISSRWRIIVAAVLSLCTLLHLGIEGFRWQMIPAYIATLCTLIVVGLSRHSRSRSKASPRSPRLHKLKRYATACLALTVLLLSVLLSFAFPIFDMPKPSGDYAVGTIQAHLIDTNRPEFYTQQPEDKRTLMVRVWYPAAKVTNQAPAAYWSAASARSRAVTRDTPLPWFTFSHLSNIPTHSFWQANIASAAEQFPVILYSHGIGIGWASSNTTLVEELASHGYVVIGIDHAYIGSLSIFPNGRRAEFDHNTAQAMNQPPTKELRDLQQKLTTSGDWREQIELYEQAMRLMTEALAMVDQALETQVADQRFVIDQLEHPENPEFERIAKRVDLSRIGVVGMSLGGSAALETCSIDPRCKAGVNLDGFHPKHIGLALQRTPFLFINRDDNLLFQSNYQAAQAPVYSVRVAGITHFNFFDFAMMSPLYKHLGILGEMNGYRMLDVTERYTLAFFNEHLKPRTTPVQKIDTVAEIYPEAQFSARNR